MLTVLQYTPGAQVTVLLQILNTSGVREDGYATPSVQHVFMPDLTESSLYPLDMARLSTGLYYHRFMLPTGATAIGTYIVDLKWTDADDNPSQDVVQVICAATAGSFSISPT